ncbi:UDP-N-acetylglucosamine transporter, putative [Entamoeba histolytica HM-1:IMSS-B]|uniref:UDP-N-acetylglucosamine transporter, putative n=6 Tax=Entamoeba histolytica TaxID=5759 RepID=C4LZJ2_ENTH1|nr:UDP-N-acetylglucosamine transporter, putative [Entamoeba histolytica HM-1:IMSS]EMD48707.1 UDPN-acetylglucosamine transporter, putative [Entamoeba histolytica KU27]EMH77464.1 UDP-N-acetylglucosamine transporter, putative [Entamoeba histolytica HM-1:IMSS-B]EMS17394.1 UDP-N-acetylglucosamine transporter, putative [Entamoeba histolytica HM-3:IMSS]ENY62445.1 UDP-N-acetylglucosamine transporter, putative [Entamoeba histolytica HM-1:IMSS-A]GAT94289.1 UDP-N-acetylglucosamine transporter putative [E|eukprot:XP_654868.1 UDP-N-acetylglucosamine transporter, putative [Entamoeba histolytica HM-1:IMSS]
MNQAILSIIFLVALTIQNTSLSLITRYSRGILKEQYSTSASILLSEITKCVISIIGIVLTRKDVIIFSHLKYLIMTSLISSIPAFIYFFQNILCQVSLANIQPGLYAVLTQVKILSAAILSVLILGKKLTATQWRSLATLVLAVITVESASRTTTGNSAVEGGHYFIGVGAALLAATASGFSGVFMEKILKNKVDNSPKLNLWERNFQLSIYSIVFSIINLVLFDSVSVFQKGIFHDFSIYTLIMIFVMSVGGILVALVMTYADVIVKGFAVSVAIVCTTTLSYFIFNTPISFEFCLGAIGVLISISNYNDQRASWSYQNPEPVIGESHDDAIAMEQPVNELEHEESIKTENASLLAEQRAENNIDVLTIDELEAPSVESKLIIDDLEN